MDTGMGTDITTKTNASESRPLRQAKPRWQMRSVGLLHRAGNALLQALQWMLYRPVHEPGRLLLFRTGSFGDGLCALPAIHAIRRQFPDARIDILTNTGHAHKSLVSIDQLLAPGVVHQVIDYQGVPLRRLARLLREQQYDAVIQLPQYSAPWRRLVRDMLVFRLLCRIPAGFGWRWDHVPVFTQAQESCGHAINERSRLLDLLEQNGIAKGSETDFRLHLTAADRAAADALLRVRLRSGKPMIGLVIGAKRPQNRWPLAGFAAVCAHFSGTHEIVLIGGPDDEALAQQLEAQYPVVSLCGALTPLQNACVMQQCRLVLSNDTGPMHLAYAVGTPLVALFSARDLPGRWYPPKRENTMVFRTFGLACSTCFSETCADNICMKKINPEVVIAAMNQLLQPEQA